MLYLPFVKVDDYPHAYHQQSYQLQANATVECYVLTNQTTPPPLKINRAISTGSSMQIPWACRPRARITGKLPIEIAVADD